MAGADSAATLLAVLFSVFALALDRFVTIGHRTQFSFGLLMRCLFLHSYIR